MSWTISEYPPPPPKPEFVERQPRQMTGWEELAPRAPLPRHHGALPEVDLVGVPRELAQLGLRAVGEERHALQELDLRVSAQRHGGILFAQGARRDVVAVMTVDE